MNSKLGTLAAIAVASLLVAGCATVPAETVGSATLIPGTVSVREEVRNFSISALVDMAGERRFVEIYATACLEGRGSIYVRSGSAMENNILNGPAAGDRIFTELCELGITQVGQRYDAKARRRAMTPEQRAVEDQQRAEAARIALQYLLLKQQ